MLDLQNVLLVDFDNVLEFLRELFKLFAFIVDYGLFEDAFLSECINLLLFG